VNKEEIINIKRAGVQSRLLQETGTQLWLAKKSLEDASIEGYKFFDKMIKKAKEHIESAKQLHDEYKQERKP
jgi:hypothetical protein